MCHNAANGLAATDTFVFTGVCVCAALLGPARCSCLVHIGGRVQGGLLTPLHTPLCPADNYMSELRHTPADAYFYAPFRVGSVQAAGARGLGTCGSQEPPLRCSAVSHMSSCISQGPPAVSWQMQSSSV